MEVAREGSREAADRLEDLEGALHGVDPTRLRGDGARVAFWANLYNGLVLHEMRARPRSGSLIRHRALFRRCAYRVGRFDYTLDVIEHGLLRGNERPPFALRRTLPSGDPRLDAAPRAPDFRVHFALNCGARSCPAPRVYDAGSVDSQLDLASAEYLAAECDVDRERRSIVLPGLIKLYRRDFGDREAQLAFAAAHLPEHGEWLARNAAAVRVSYARFDWTIVAPGA